MIKHISIATLALSGGLLATTAMAADTVYDQPVTFDLSFVLHVEQDLPEQDVFIERDPGTGQVYRATKGDLILSQPVYASASPLEHDPFSAEALGPHPKGEPLGMDLGSWLEAEGQGRYQCKDGEGYLDVAFAGLVPEGVYTMWHFFMAMPPTDPFIGTYDLPIGARDGSQSIFQAEADGKARFERTFKPCLQLTGEHLMSGLAIAYHSDGETYGPLPGDFGNKSHIHLYLALPKRAGI